MVITIQMRQERNNKKFNSNARKHNERKYIRIRMYVSMNELELQKVNSVQIKSIFFMKIVTLSLVFQQVSTKMSLKLYKYLSAIRGYYYRKYWQSVVEQELDCMHERYNPFDSFCYKAIKKTTGKTEGHLPMETLRVTKHLLDRGPRFTIVVPHQIVFSISSSCNWNPLWSWNLPSTSPERQKGC